MPYGRRRFYRGRKSTRVFRKSTTSKKSVGGLVRKTWKPRRKAVRYQLSKPMRSLVDSRVDKHLETKTLMMSLWMPSPGAGIAYTLRPAITNLSVATIIPRLPQANSVGDISNASEPRRIGNKITPTYCKLRLRLWVDQNDTTSGIGAGDRCTIQPYVFVGTHKTRKSYATLTQNNWECLDEFWHTQSPFATTVNPTGGMGDATNFSGQRYDFTQGRLNTSKFQPIKGGVRTWEMTRPLGYAIYEGEGGAGYTIPYNGRTLEFRIPMPKTLVYSDNTSDYPTYVPFVAIGYTYMNGAGANEQAALRCESTVNFQWTDA